MTGSKGCMKYTESETTMILLVEDEESLGAGLEYNLGEEGYQVVRARDGKQAVNSFPEHPIDLVILDIMIPYIDGFEVAETIRDLSPQVPILMLTARTAPADRIRGLKSGADDYLAKPFHLRELLLRVEGMLRRKTWYRESLQGNPTYTFGKNRIDFANFRCEAGKQQIRLTPLEAALLRYLVDHAETVLSREELLQEVWKTTTEIETRTVDNFIVRLRKYFEPDPSNPRHIKNVRGIGYLFSPVPRE